MNWQNIWDFFVIVYLIATPVCLSLNAFAIWETRAAWKQAVADFKSNNRVYQKSYYEEKIRREAREVLHLRRWRWIILFWPLYGPYRAFLWVALGVLSALSWATTLRFSLKDRAVENEMIRRHATEKL